MSNIRYMYGELDLVSNKKSHRNNNSDVCHNLLYIEFLPLKLQNGNSNKVTP